MSKKVLVITYDYYPDNSPNTYRWHNILRLWSKKNIDIHVISKRKYGLSHFEIIDGIYIHRAGNSIIEKIRKLLLPDSKTAEFKNTQQSYKDSFIRKVYNNTWSKLYWPDYAFLWYFSALRLSQKIINTRNINNIITVSWPFTDHLIGYKLKNNNNVYWLADTIDPFSFHPSINNQKVYSRINYIVEKQVLNTSDIVSVLTNKMKDKYISLFPKLNDKVKINHNVFIPPFIPVRLSVKDKLIKLVFVGTLNPNVRSPDNLLDFFKQLLNLHSRNTYELHFYGNINASLANFNPYKDLLKESIFIHDFIPKKQIIDVLLDATILVNIGNNNPYQEPSKLIEYVYVGKPILNLYSNIDDSSKIMLKDYPLVFNAFSKGIINKSLVYEFDKFIKKNHGKSVDKSVINTLLKNYYINEVAHKYFSYLWGVIK